MVGAPCNHVAWVPALGCVVLCTLGVCSVLCCVVLCSVCALCRVVYAPDTLLFCCVLCAPDTLLFCCVLCARFVCLARDQIRNMWEQSVQGLDGVPKRLPIS